jgi:hypothetical protein
MVALLFIELKGIIHLSSLCSAFLLAEAISTGQPKNKTLRKVPLLLQEFSLSVFPFAMLNL